MPILRKEMPVWIDMSKFSYWNERWWYFQCPGCVAKEWILGRTEQKVVHNLIDGVGYGSDYFNDAERLWLKNLALCHELHAFNDDQIEQQLTYYDIEMHDMEEADGSQ